MVILSTVLLCCNNDKSRSTQDLKSTGARYGSIEIYCWCFESNDYETVSGCSTPKSIEAVELIKEENLFQLINNRDTIERLKSLIFNEKKLIKEERNPPDSRFVFVFKVNDSKADTINVFSDSSLHYNNRYYFNYPFNVMDSIKVILDKTEINCKSNYGR